jgi:hypothetical protein
MTIEEEKKTAVEICTENVENIIVASKSFNFKWIDKKHETKAIRQIIKKLSETVNYFGKEILEAKDSEIFDFINELIPSEFYFISIQFIPFLLLVYATKGRTGEEGLNTETQHQFRNKYSLESLLLSFQKINLSFAESVTSPSSSSCQHQIKQPRLNSETITALTPATLTDFYELLLFYFESFLGPKMSLNPFDESMDDDSSPRNISNDSLFAATLLSMLLISIDNIIPLPYNLKDFHLPDYLDSFYVLWIQSFDKKSSSSHHINGNIHGEEKSSNPPNPSVSIETNENSSSIKVPLVVVNRHIMRLIVSIMHNNIVNSDDPNLVSFSKFCLEMVLQRCRYELFSDIVLGINSLKSQFF